MTRITKLRNRIMWADREIAQLEERLAQLKQRRDLLLAELETEQREP